MQDIKLQIAIQLTDFLLKHFNLSSYQELDSLLGIRRGDVAVWRKRGITLKHHDTILSKCNSISRSWLKTGEGSILAVQPEIVPTYELSDDYPHGMTAVNDNVVYLREDQRSILAIWERLDCEGKAVILQAGRLIAKSNN